MKTFDVPVAKGHGLVKVEITVFTLAKSGEGKMKLTVFETPFAPVEVKKPEEYGFLLRFVPKGE